jgi:hypothetical protein
LLGQETLTKNLFCGRVWSRNLDKNPFIENKGCFSQGYSMEKRTCVQAFLILGILLSAMAGLVSSVGANPLSQAQYAGNKPPVAKTSITILSPENTPMNNTVHNTNSLSLFLNVSFIKPNTILKAYVYSEYLSEIYFKADWQQNETYVYTFKYYEPKINEFNYQLNFTGIPEGKHNITFYAIQDGVYSTSIYSYSSLEGKIDSSVFFTIDTICPNVSVLSAENRTYDTPDIMLNFTVDEPVSQIWYVLDGQENVTIGENVTLTGLKNGEHNVTVYAQDLAGHVGASKTVIFTVAKPEPFPTTLVIVPTASVAFVGVGLLVYLKKRKR